MEYKKERVIFLKTLLSLKTECDNENRHLLYKANEHSVSINGLNEEIKKLEQVIMDVVYYKNFARQKAKNCFNLGIILTFATWSVSSFINMLNHLPSVSILYSLIPFSIFASLKYYLDTFERRKLVKNTNVDALNESINKYKTKCEDYTKELNNIKLQQVKNTDTINNIYRPVINQTYEYLNQILTKKEKAELDFPELFISWDDKINRFHYERPDAKEGYAKTLNKSS